MAITPPFQLLLNQRPFGTITTYDYNTPWALGRLKAADEALRAQFVRVCEYLNWLESLPEETSDPDEAVELAQRNISQDIVAHYLVGAWAIATSNGDFYEITPPHFDQEGFVEWRWGHLIP